MNLFETYGPILGGICTVIYVVITSLKTRRDNEVDRLRKRVEELEREKTETDAEHEKATAKLNTDHAAAIAKLNAEHDDAIARRDAAHTAEVEHLVGQADLSDARMARAQAAEIAAVDKLHATRVALAENGIPDPTISPRTPPTGDPNP